MNFGLTSKIGEYYLAQQYRKNAAIGKSSGMSFAEYTDYYESELRAKGMPLIEYSQMVKSAGSFSDVFPDYQVITKVGTSNVQQGLWERNDFPFDKYFDNSTTVDELNNWRPTGKNPKMSDSVSQRQLWHLWSRERRKL